LVLRPVSALLVLSPLPDRAVLFASTILISCLQQPILVPGPGADLELDMFFGGLHLVVSRVGLRPVPYRRRETSERLFGPAVKIHSIVSNHDVAEMFHCEVTLRTEDIVRASKNLSSYSSDHHT